MVFAFSSRPGPWLSKCIQYSVRLLMRQLSTSNLIWIDYGRGSNSAYRASTAARPGLVSESRVMSLSRPCVRLEGLQSPYLHCRVRCQSLRRSSSRRCALPLARWFIGELVLRMILPPLPWQESWGAPTSYPWYLLQKIHARLALPRWLLCLLIAPRWRGLGLRKTINQFPLYPFSSERGCENCVERE